MPGRGKRNELEETRWKEAQAGIDDLHLDITSANRDVDPFEERWRLNA